MTARLFTLSLKNARLADGDTVLVRVIIKKTKDNYSAYLPDVPGCVADGDTPEETLKLFKWIAQYGLGASVKWDSETKTVM